MKKFIGLVAVLVVAVMSLAGVASATSNKADGTVLTGTNNGNISLSGIVTCGSSTVQGPLKNETVGISQTFTTASFSSCNVGVTACNLSSWKLITGSGGPTVWGGQVQGVCVDINLFGGCRYQGTLSGGSYSETSDQLVLAGSLSKTSGSVFCPSSGTTNGTYDTTPTDLDLS